LNTSASELVKVLLDAALKARQRCLSLTAADESAQPALPLWPSFITQWFLIGTEPELLNRITW